MKKLFLTIALFASTSLFLFAQNTFPSSGNVGIGTTSPESVLDVKGSEGKLLIGAGGYAGHIAAEKFLCLNSSEAIYFRHLGTPKDIFSYTDLMILNNTNVQIFKPLYVHGKIKALEVKVETPLSFPDYVFAKDYKLTSLVDLEAYINKNKHLPGVPSAEEIAVNGGIDLGALNVKLLEKVEELTLYILAQDKDIIELKKEIEALKKK